MCFTVYLHPSIIPFSTCFSNKLLFFLLFSNVNQNTIHFTAPPCTEKIIHEECNLHPWNKLLKRKSSGLYQLDFHCRKHLFKKWFGNRPTVGKFRWWNTKHQRIFAGSLLLSSVLNVHVQCHWWMPKEESKPRFPSLFLSNRERVLVHELSHFLLEYLYNFSQNKDMCIV